jgi:hypothetical protein
MSLKDRGAILPAGHFANWAFGTVKRVLLFLVPLWSKLPDWYKNSMMKKHMPYINKGWIYSSLKVHTT